MANGVPLFAIRVFQDRREIFQGRALGDQRIHRCGRVGKTERHLGVGGSPLSGQEEEIQKEPQKPDLPYEYCSTFYLLHSLTWAMQKTGEAKYGDMFYASIADEKPWVVVSSPDLVKQIFTGDPAVFHGGVAAQPFG